MELLPLRRASGPNLCVFSSYSLYTSESSKTCIPSFSLMIAADSKLSVHSLSTFSPETYLRISSLSLGYVLLRDTVHRLDDHSGMEYVRIRLGGRFNTSPVELDLGNPSLG